MLSDFRLVSLELQNIEIVYTYKHMNFHTKGIKILLILRNNALNCTCHYVSKEMFMDF